MQEESAQLKSGVLTVSELLEDGNLVIPEYQRPYKWAAKNISQLLEDIRRHTGKGIYRLGTVVFHVDDEDPNKRNIVDGQQRTLSLMLAVRAIINTRLNTLSEDSPNSIQNPALRETLQQLDERMIDPEINSLISQKNLRYNYQIISRIVSRAEFTEEHIHFLLNQCEVVYFELNDISEAFQFFDSQNARGRDLAPHDLLKAFHLREFVHEDEKTKANAVSQWENSDTQKLANLFSNYLFRIRNWSRGASARHFGKGDVGLFKGINIDRIDRYPYAEALRMAHHFADNEQASFPFHLDQAIINGRRFFEMVAHYQKQVDELKLDTLESLHGYAPRIVSAINNYVGMHRTGDRYVRIMFDCLLLYYLDKFGRVEISRAIEIIFIWAYRLRLSQRAVRLSSMDNHVYNNNLFLAIKEATQPSDFLAVELPILKDSKDKKDEKSNQIRALFQEMGYCE